MSDKGKKARQQKNRMKKAEQKRRRTKEKQRERRLADERRKLRLSQQAEYVAVSEAFGMPVRFRRLEASPPPRVEEGKLILTDVDIQLSWFESQEQRRTGKDAEGLTALRIDSCEEISIDQSEAAQPWLGASGLRVFRCRAALFELIDPDTEYGAWYRLQERQGEISPETDSIETEIRFDLVLGIIPRQAREMLEQRISWFTPVKVRGGLTMLDCSIAPELVESLTDLQVDRWFEVTAYLHIYIGRLLDPPRFSKPERFALEAELGKIEEDELKTAQLLEPLAVASRQAKQELDEALAELERARQRAEQKIDDAKSRLRTAHGNLNHANAEVSRLQGVWGQNRARFLEAVSGGGEAAEANRKAAEQAQRSVEQAVDRVKSCQAQVEAAERALTAAERSKNSEVVAVQLKATRLKELFDQARCAEAPVAKRFEFAAIRREEVLADLGLDCNHECSR